MSILLETPTVAFNTADQSSLANIDQVITTHHSIAMTIDFTAKQLRGTITYTLRALQDAVSFVDLDIRNIKVSSAQVDNVDLVFQIAKYEKITENLGDQLKIALASPLTTGQEIKLSVSFETLESKESSLNWLNPSQTEGKAHPYMFTQSEPIWNRTVFPCQDTPAVKATFDARITVPKPFKAYISGRLISSEETEDANILVFEQTVPIPAYLFAIVAGNLVEKKVSERTSVISEPEVIEKSTAELEDMEKQLTALENFVTPYEWKEYKVVVLPPSFPYGGMENPLLTFASPSIIVGDKSNTDVIIHEMAHSWSGNLFSCKNWNSFWINEGWTVFFETEVIRILHGEEAYNMAFTLHDNDLKSTIDAIGHGESYTTLNPQIGFDNPDDAFSTVPYIRGFQLLTHIQNTVGVPAFRAYTKAFVEEFKLKSLNTVEFQAFFLKHFGQATYDTIAWEDWINKTGYPPQVFNVQSESIRVTKAAAEAFLESNTLDKATWDGFVQKQKIIFMQTVNEARMTQEKAKLLHETLNLEAEKNPEIYTQWFNVALAVNYEAVVPAVQAHLAIHGRMKFVRGIYKALAKFNHGLAVETFNKNADLYYGITYTLTKADLKI